MRLDGLEFLIEISIAASVINMILIIVLFLMIMGVSSKVRKQNDSIAFIHKRAKMSDRREETLIEKEKARRKRN